MKKILLIGSEGYIGSYLKTIINCNSFDLSLGFDYRNLLIDDIKKYDFLILLAGHSSVASCANNQLAAFKNNVDNFSRLLYNIEKAQKPIKLIYASSSSVYGQTGAGIVSENFSDFIPHNTYDITKHFIDILAKDSNVEYYGLRFGTVCGYSPVLRTDVMINSMVRSAIDLGHIKLYVKKVNRPILGINDLGRSVQRIIDQKENKKGIYNLASFNSTAEYIASVVSNLCGVPIVEVDSPQEVSNAKEQTITYDFAISTEKFSESFQFKFQDSIESITKSLIENWGRMKKIDRTTKLIYETKN